MASSSACVSFNLVTTHPGQMEWGVVRGKPFRRVLEDLGEHSVETQSVIPSEQWKQWFLGLDERVPFSPTDAADLERSLWQIMEKVTCGKPSYTFTTGGLPSCGTWNQLPNGPLKRNYGNIGPTGLLATWPLMLRTSRQWRQ